MKRIFLALILLIISLAVGLFLMRLDLPLRINLSPSMPRGLYWAVNKPLVKGALVEACLPTALAIFGMKRNYIGHGKCSDGSEPVVKEVAGLAGDSVQLEQGRVKINGHVIPGSATLLTDEQGRTVPVIARGLYSIKKNQVWLMGTHSPQSWDSRYYGAIDQHCILSIVKPLWTE